VHTHGDFAMSIAVASQYCLHIDRCSRQSRSDASNLLRSYQVVACQDRVTMATVFAPLYGDHSGYSREDVGCDFVDRDNLHITTTGV